jgi:hypothetical protein
LSLPYKPRAVTTQATILVVLKVLSLPYKPRAVTTNLNSSGKCNL